MTKIYFTNKKSGSRHATNEYHFNHLLTPTYGWYLREWVFSIVEVVNVDDKNKTLYGFNEQWVLTKGIGSITDEGLAIVEVNDAKLAALWKTLEDLTDKMSSQSVVEINIITPAEAIVWMKTFTEYNEIEPGKFLIREASEDEVEWITEAEYLTI